MTDAVCTVPGSYYTKGGYPYAYFVPIFWLSNGAYFCKHFQWMYVLLQQTYVALIGVAPLFRGYVLQLRYLWWYSVIIKWRVPRNGDL